MNKRALLGLILALMLVPAVSIIAAPVVGDYANPMDVEMGDPYVFLDNGTYYLYGTVSGWNFEVWSSPDMMNWKYRGVALPQQAYGINSYWAPEVYKQGTTYYMFYACRASDNVLRICVATASSPLGPFSNAAAPLHHSTAVP